MSQTIKSFFTSFISIKRTFFLVSLGKVSYNMENDGKTFCTKTLGQKLGELLSRYSEKGFLK